MSFAIKKSHKFLAIFFLVVYFLYLVISQVPAKVAANVIHSTAPNVWLNSVTGTAWKGVSHQAQIDFMGKPIALGKVSWDVKLLPLLMLKACVGFKASEAGILAEGLFCKSISGAISLDDTQMDFPMSVASGVPMLPPVTGNFSAQINHLDANVKKNQLYFNALDAQASWQNARVFVDSSWYTLGALAVELDGASDGVAAFKVFDLGGPFGLEGEGVWSAAKSLTVAASVTPKANANPQIIDVLQAVGEEKTPGVYTVRWP